MQLLTTIIALCASAVLVACMLSTIYTVIEFIVLMIMREPVAQALRTCARSFVESFPYTLAEAAVIALVSFLLSSLILSII